MLTSTERSVYDAIQRLAANGSGFVFYASLETTAAEAGCSISTVQRALASLDRLGVVWEYEAAWTFKNKHGRWLKHWQTPTGDWVPSRIYQIVRYASFRLKVPVSRRLTNYRSSDLRSSRSSSSRHVRDFVSYAARGLRSGSDAERGPPRKRRRRPPEPDFTALVRVTCSNVNLECGVLNAALKSIRAETGLRGPELAAEIVRHAKAYRRMALAHNWGLPTPTPMGLCKHWNRVTA